MYSSINFTMIWFAKAVSIKRGQKLEDFVGDVQGSCAVPIGNLVSLGGGGILSNKRANQCSPTLPLNEALVL